VQVVRRVYRADECYSGPEAINAPDLIVGYERDYRASWETCLGEFDQTVLVDNHKAWSADHCIAHDVVPGILLSNRKILLDDPALIDVAPTVLAEFGVSKPGHMTGRNFYKENAARIAAR
jgi:predicted AlkP superfamily phosphohydrolase/phosphomutase